MRFEDFTKLAVNDAVSRLKGAYNAVFVAKKPHSEWENDLPKGELDEVTGQFKNSDAMWRYWDDHAHDHLPLALKVIDRRDLEYGLLGRHVSAKLQVDEHQKEKALLFVAGYSPEQLALSIAVHILNGCRRFVPVSGPAWAAVKDQVRDHLTNDLFFGMDDDFQFDDAQRIEDDRAEHPAETFATISNWIRQHRDKVLAIDCTGGQKPMDAGAIQAASYWGVPAYYVHFKRYDGIHRRPKPHSCIYVQLTVPESAFSLTTRQTICNKFACLDFSRAIELTDVLISDVRACAEPEASGLAESTIFAALSDIQSAQDLLRACEDWAHLRYASTTLAGRTPELHKFFAENVARSRRESIVALMDDECLLYYVADEYWRLSAMLDDINLVRDVLIGAVGLIELIVDSIFHLQWYSFVRIAEVKNWEFVVRDGHANRSQTWNSSELIGKALPLKYFAHSQQGQKIKLIKTGNAQLRVWLPLDECGFPTLSTACPAPEHSSERAELDLALSAPVRRMRVSAGPWVEWWGNYPNPFGSDRDWVQWRHNVAHLRTPLTESEAQFVRNQIVARFTAQFIELLYLLRQREGTPLALQTLGLVNSSKEVPKEWGSVSDVVELGDLTWQNDSRLAHSARVPWHGMTSQFQQWLSVPTI